MKIFDNIKSAFSKTSIQGGVVPVEVQFAYNQELLKVQRTELLEQRIQLEVKTLDTWEAVLMVVPDMNLDALSGDKKIEACVLIQRHVGYKSLLDNVNALIRVFDANIFS